MKKSINDKFIDLIENKFNSISISNVPKRMEINGIKDLYLRLVWVLTYQVNGEETTFYCDWDGFGTTKELVNDIVNKFYKK